MSVASLLLEVKNLKVHFPVKSGFFGDGNEVLKAVDGVSFSIDQGETLGLVGESGCGKSTLARAIVRLITPTEGSINFRGKDFARLSASGLREVRKDLQMVFQDPYASLNPRMTVEAIVSEPLRNYGESANVRDRVMKLLETVGLDASTLSRFPHEFSGGQRQRIGIARALALQPAMVVADEPASALDVSIQAQIINLLRNLQSKLGLSYLFISHDLSVVSMISRRVAVMYLGEIVEIGMTRDVFIRPAHPYTKALISAVPIPDPVLERSRRRIVLRGDVPSPMNKPSGCPFRMRCPDVFARCIEEKPILLERNNGRSVACHLTD